MTIFSQCKIDTNYSAKRKSEQRWKEEEDSIEVLTRSENAESKLRTLSICSARNQDRTWNSKMNLEDQREFWTRSSLMLVKTEMKAIPRETKLLTSGHKLQNSKETSTWSSRRGPTCSEKSQDSEMCKT